MRLFFCGSLPSACISDCSARSLRSALNVLKSVSSAENAPLVSAAPSALPVVPLSKPCPCPELYAVSAAINLVLSSVKSRSTRMFVASDTSAIKSAGCTFVPTNFFAASTERSICSGSIAEKSKKSSINRRSRASSDNAACFPERSSVPAPATPDTVDSAVPAVCSSSTFSKSKVEISCFFPSSKSVKSPFFRSRTRFPLFVVCHHIHQHEFGGHLNARFVHSGLSRLLGNYRRGRLEEQPGRGEDRKCFSWKPHIHLSSETEPCLHRHPPHPASPRDLPESKGIHHRIDGREVHGIENIVRGDAQIQSPGFFDRDRFIERHVQRNLSRPLDNISPGVAKVGTIRIRTSGARRAKGSRIEPLQRGWVAYRNRLPRDRVCAQRPAYAAPDVQSSAQHARCEVQPGSNRKVTAPLPSSHNVAPCTLGHKLPVFAERHIHDPVSREFVPLIEAGKPAVR